MKDKAFYADTKEPSSKTHYKSGFLKVLLRLVFLCMRMCADSF
jgi:hypothetical protein